MSTRMCNRFFYLHIFSRYTKMLYVMLCLSAPIVHAMDPAAPESIDLGRVRPQHNWLSRTTSNAMKSSIVQNIYYCLSAFAQGAQPINISYQAPVIERLKEKEKESDDPAPVAHQLVAGNPIAATNYYRTTQIGQALERTVIPSIQNRYNDAKEFATQHNLAVPIGGVVLSMVTGRPEFAYIATAAGVVTPVKELVESGTKLAATLKGKPSHPAVSEQSCSDEYGDLTQTTPVSDMYVEETTETFITHDSSLAPDHRSSISSSSAAPPRTLHHTVTSQQITKTPPKLGPGLEEIKALGKVAKGVAPVIASFGTIVGNAPPVINAIGQCAEKLIPLVEVLQKQQAQKNGPQPSCKKSLALQKNDTKRIAKINNVVKSGKDLLEQATPLVHALNQFATTATPLIQGFQNQEAGPIAPLSEEAQLDLAAHNRKKMKHFNNIAAHGAQASGNLANATKHVHDIINSPNIAAVASHTGRTLVQLTIYSGLGIAGVVTLYKALSREKLDKETAIRAGVGGAMTLTALLLASNIMQAPVPPIVDGPHA